MSSLCVPDEGRARGGASSQFVNCVGGKLARLCFHSDAQSARVSHRVMYLMISQDLHVPNGPNPCERDPVHLGELQVATMLAKSSGAAPTFGASRSMHASRLF